MGKQLEKIFLSKMGQEKKPRKYLSRFLHPGPIPTRSNRKYRLQIFAMQKSESNWYLAVQKRRKAQPLVCLSVCRRVARIFRVCVCVCVGGGGDAFGLGSDTNIPKFGLNMFREILEKSSKYLQKFSKYLKISRKSRTFKLNWSSSTWTLAILILKDTKITKYFI